MTPERLESMKATAESWDASNPFKEPLSKRLAKLGGQYRAPQAADDRSIMVDEDAVALMRDLPAAITEYVQEF